MGWASRKEPHTYRSGKVAIFPRLGGGGTPVFSSLVTLWCSQDPLASDAWPSPRLQGSTMTPNRFQRFFPGPTQV